MEINSTPPLRQRLCVIFNPKAGQGAHRLQETLRHLESLGVSCELKETRCAGDGTERARQALDEGGYDAIVAAGGDGTVNEVAHGLTGSDIPLGIIPAGTANVLAIELGMSSSPEGQAKMLAFGESRTVYPGSVNGRYFLLVVGVGLDARAVRGVFLKLKKFWGEGAYALSALRELLRYQPPALKVTVEDQQYKAAWVMVFKASRYAGDWVAEPEARLEDPELSVVMLPAQNRWQLIPHLLDFVRRKPLSRVDICLRQVRRVLIEGPTGEPAQMDGDELGTVPLDIELSGKTLKLIHP